MQIMLFFIPENLRLLNRTFQDVLPKNSNLEPSHLYLATQTDPQILFESED